MSKTSLYTRRIAISAIFLSIALVFRLIFSWYLPLFGQSGMRVGLAPIFSMMPAILFGPLYGAIVAALTDFLGWAIRPMGPFVPLLNIAFALGGFLRGALWWILRGKSNRIMRLTILVLTVLLLVFGISNSISLGADGISAQFYDNIENPQLIDSSDMRSISRLIITRSQGAENPAESLAPLLLTATTGLISAAAFGFLLLAADFFISKRFNKKNTRPAAGLSEAGQETASPARESRVLPLLITILVSGLFVTSLNTVILRETIFTSWQYLPFVVVWAPRAIEAIISNTIYVYFVALLLGLFEGQKNLRELIR